MELRSELEIIPQEGNGYIYNILMLLPADYIDITSAKNPYEKIAHAIKRLSSIDNKID
jgi:hypothetical protein